MAAFQWDFEPRSVNFRLSLKASFHPSLAGASLVLPWIDGAAVGKGEPPVFGSGPEVVIPFSGVEPDAGKGGKKAGGSKEPAEAPPAGGLERTRISIEKELGSMPVTLDLVQALQQAVLSPELRLPGPEGTSHTARSGARISLAPLLLSGDQEEAQEGAVGSRSRGPRVRPCWVSAAGTDSAWVAGLHKWELRISTDAPVLSRPMLEKLLPVCITVEAVRGLPNEPWLIDKCEDVYLEVYPQLSPATQKLAEQCPRLRTAAKPHGRDIRFGDQLVWLLGLTDVHSVRSWLMHEGLVVEVHDRDMRRRPPKEPARPEVDAAASSTPSGKGAKAAPAAVPATEEEEPQPVEEQKPIMHAHGVASFLLAPLLESKTLSETLRVGVCPSRGNKKRRRAKELLSALPAKGLLDNIEELDEAIEARLDKREDTTEYHGRQVACTVRAELAVPLPSSAVVRQANEERQLRGWEGSEQCIANSHVWSTGAAPDAAEPAGKMAGKQASKSPPVADGEGVEKAPSGAMPFRAKLPLPSGEELVGPWRPRREDTEADERKLVEALTPEGGEVPEPVPKAKKAAKKKAPAKAAAKKELPAASEKEVARAKAVCEELHKEEVHGLDLRYERFGRIVLLVREGVERDTIQSVLRAVRTHNAGVLGIDPDDPELRTTQLSEEQKADPHLDLLTGFGCLEGQHRLLVVEGLRERGLQVALQAVPNRDVRRNSADYKLLYHSGMGFADRLYGDFGAVLKQVKVRQPLGQLSSRPDLYSNSGLAAEDVLAGNEAPKLLSDMFLAERAKALHQASSWPTSVQLKNLEILYGAYMTDAEIEADPNADDGTSKMAARMKLKQSLNDSGMQFSQQHGETTQMIDNKKTKSAVLLETVEDSLRQGSLTKRPALDQTNQEFQATLDLRKSFSAPNLIRRNALTVKEESLANARMHDALGKKRERETPFLEGKGVFMYSGQKLNSAELQKDWMRKHMEQDWKKNLHTHSLDHESQSFDISGQWSPGVPEFKSTIQNNSYANLPGDNRPPWRHDPARPKEAFRKPGRDLDVARQEELHEPFIDNEWHHLAMGSERRKPLASHKTFDPDRVPHLRVVTERPFDPSLVGPKEREFGPKVGFESVFYHGRKPREGIPDEEIRRNAEEQKAHADKMLGSRSMGCFTQSATRKCVTDLDRNEPVAKDYPGMSTSSRMPVATLRVDESFRDGDWNIRVRPNPGRTARFDVVTGGHITQELRYDPRPGQAPNFKKEPWKHGGEPDRTNPLSKEYMSQHDFNLTRPPPKSRAVEAQVTKSATRAPVSFQEKTSKAAYSRPATLRAVAAPA